MPRITVKALQAFIDGQHATIEEMEAKIESQETWLETLKGNVASHRADTIIAKAEVRRLELLASEMRGFIMAHHSKETEDGGTTYYKEPYGNMDNEENQITIPIVKYPFMDAKIGAGA